jgi:hypothetical protein
MRAATKRAGLVLALAAAAAFAQSGQGINFIGPASRVITPSAPNGQNSIFFFCIDNPAISGVSIEIFNLLGRSVFSYTYTVPPAAQANGPGGVCVKPGTTTPEYVSWDGTSSGINVHSGIYVYRIRSEEKTYTGSLMVVR